MSFVETGCGISIYKGFNYRFSPIYGIVLCLVMNLQSWKVCSSLCYMSELR